MMDQVLISTIIGFSSHDKQLRYDVYEDLDGLKGEL